MKLFVTLIQEKIEIRRFLTKAELHQRSTGLNTSARLNIMIEENFFQKHRLSTMRLLLYSNNTMKIFPRS